jgi:hypothetical protein
MIADRMSPSLGVVNMISIAHHVLLSLFSPWDKVRRKTLSLHCFQPQMLFFGIFWPDCRDANGKNMPVCHRFPDFREIPHYRMH